MNVGTAPARALFDVVWRLSLSGAGSPALLQRSPVILPMPGTLRVAQVEQHVRRRACS